MPAVIPCRDCLVGLWLRGSGGKLKDMASLTSAGGKLKGMASLTSASIGLSSRQAIKKAPLILI